MTASAGKRPAHDLGYLPALDGWRAISILLVVVSHGGLGHLVPGGLGVTIFFFISGFLITTLLLNEHQAQGQITLRLFYLRRFWRLSPALLAYIALSSLLILAINGRLDLREPLSAIFYFANYYNLYWHYESLPFAPSPLKIVWSLAIEEHYYIFFAPLVCVWAHTRQRLLAVLTILLAVPLALRLGIVFGGDLLVRPEGYTYAATETRIDSIAWGALLAWCRHHYPESDCQRWFENKFAIAASIGLLLLCLLIRSDDFRETLRYTLQGIGLMAIFHSTLFGSTLAWTRRWLASRPAVVLGKLSYSIYLYHWLALVLAGAVAGQEQLSPLWLGTYYLLTALFSLASYRYVESPCLALRKRYGSHAA